jgi:hypothetical protein
MNGRMRATNSLQCVRAVLHSVTPDRVPVCLNNFTIVANESRMSNERKSTAGIEKPLHSPTLQCRTLNDSDTTKLPMARGAKSLFLPRVFVHQLGKHELERVYGILPT